MSFLSLYPIVFVRGCERFENVEAGMNSLGWARLGIDKKYGMKGWVYSICKIV